MGLCLEAVNNGLMFETNGGHTLGCHFLPLKREKIGTTAARRDTEFTR